MGGGVANKKEMRRVGATTETKVGGERKIFWSGIEHLEEKERETEKVCGGREREKK